MNESRERLRRIQRYVSRLRSRGWFFIIISLIGIAGGIKFHMDPNSVLTVDGHRAGEPWRTLLVIGVPCFCLTMGFLLAFGKKKWLVKLAVFREAERRWWPWLFKFDRN